MAQYGVGVVGCGGISTVHFRAVQQVERARLVAARDSVEERTQKATEEFHLFSANRCSG